MTVLEPGVRAHPGRKAPLGHPARQVEGPADGEELSIARVVEGLVAMFPAVPEADIRECVERVRAGFADARIRTYIPILVARRARSELTGSSSLPDAERVR
jgi:hypothetical protein